MEGQKKKKIRKKEMNLTEMNLMGGFPMIVSPNVWLHCSVGRASHRSRVRIPLKP